MTTLADLANRAQGNLDDENAGSWSQALVEEWCKEAIRDYNRHFPRMKSTTINCVTDQREYNLPSDYRRMVSVEYPQGEDPPQYLEKRSRLGGYFWGVSGYYDVLEYHNASVDGLVISEKPTTGEDIEVFYMADHDLSLAPEDTLTMPERHEGVVLEFVLWRAWLELLAGEQQAPTSSSSLLMSQYASNADRAKRAYVESLARLLRAEEGESARVTWRLDKWDRIY